MKTFKLRYLTIAVVSLVIGLSACKSKKVLQKPATTEVEAKVTPIEQKKPDTTVAPKKEVVVQEQAALKPKYKYTNLQFEFNSAILKTSSYPMLDKVAMEIKNTSVNIRLNGYASAEGTPQHNMELSRQRADAVKTYLLNAGVTDTQVTAQGFGEDNPIKPNTTEDNRALNRRVEIKVAR